MANGRWFITKSDGARHASGSPGPATFDRDDRATGRNADLSLPEDLEAELERAVGALASEAPSVELEDLPDESGLYTLQARSDRALEALGLDDRTGHRQLVERILYLGKAQESVRGRLKGGHFAVGKTGHSTVRRTFAALLGLQAIPRPTRVAKPSRQQLMTMTANYAVPPAEDETLSAWMRSNLLVRAIGTSWTPLASLERAAGELLEPPLDQEKVPFWAPNPWRADVAAARERKRMEARQRIGLL